MEKAPLQTRSNDAYIISQPMLQSQQCGTDQNVANIF